MLRTSPPSTRCWAPSLPLCVPTSQRRRLHPSRSRPRRPRRCRPRHSPHPLTSRACPCRPRPPRSPRRVRHTPLRHLPARRARSDTPTRRRARTATSAVVSQGRSKSWCARTSAMAPAARFYAASALMTMGGTGPPRWRRPTGGCVRTASTSAAACVHTAGSTGRRTLVAASRGCAVVHSAVQVHQPIRPLVSRAPTLLRHPARRNDPFRAVGAIRAAVSRAVSHTVPPGTPAVFLLRVLQIS